MSRLQATKGNTYNNKYIIYVITLRRKVITPIPTMYDMNIDYICVFHRHLHCYVNMFDTFLPYTT